MNNKQDTLHHPLRIAMAVNNPATNDYRVVKTAEMVAKAGYECHVVGVWKPGFELEEKINGVTYHRIPITKGFKALISGVSPKLLSLLKNKAARKKSNNRAQKINVWIVCLHLLLGALSIMSVLIFFPLLYVILFPFLFIHIFYRFLRPLLGVFLRKDGAGIKIKSIIKKIYSDYKYSIKELLKKKKSIFELILRLKPENSVLGVYYLMGRYFSTLYPKLAELNADVYHAHELWVLESCSLAAEKNKAKLIYDSHELEPYRNNNWSVESNKARLSYEKKYFHRADEVFAVSKGCAKQLEEIYNIDKVHLLRNTPVLAKLVVPNITVREEIGINGNEKLMVYTGLMTINRGIETIIKSLKLLPNWHLVTVGPSNIDVKSKLIELAKIEGVFDRVHMHDKVPPEELVEFISTADLAVIPIINACLSYYYCMPNKLFEAAFAGLPIAASNLPDMKDFIIKNSLGEVFEDGSEESLATVVKSICKKNKIKELDKYSIRQKYCFEEEVKPLLMIYSKFENQDFKHNHR